ncbi:hypothetical protein N9N10_00375 [Luminiphilus sp.]|nr:hypothetical protein [Luminiphilus sp.]
MKIFCESLSDYLPSVTREPLGRAYNRTSHLAERKEMMQVWADYLDVLRNEA